MDAQNGALHFDADVDKRNYIKSLVDMENRTILFGNNVVAGNAAIQKSFDRLSQSISNGRLNRAIDNVDSRIEAFVNNTISNTARGGTGFAALTNGITNNLQSLETRFERVAAVAQRSSQSASNSIQGIGTQSQQTSNDVGSAFSKLGAAVTAYLSVQTLQRFGSQLISVTGQIQQIKVAYSTMLGSKRQADELFGQSVELAKTTPFSLIEVATATKQLLAYGFSAKDVTGTVAKLGDVAAGVSAPLGDIAYLYGTLKTQGRAYAQDIRQFTGRGIPIIAELAKQFNTTETNVNALVESGKVGFPEIEKAFNKLTGAGGQFFNLMQAQSKTITGQISNLGDNFDQLLSKLGNDNKGLISGGIAGLNSLIDNYQLVIDIITELIILYGSYRVAQLLLTASSYGTTAALALETVAYRLLTLGLDAFNTKAILAATTTAALTVALAAAATIIYILTANTNGLAASQENLNEINKDGIKDSQQQIDKLRSLQRSIDDLRNSETDRLKAVTALRSIMGDRLKQYSDEELLAGKAKNAINLYTEALKENARIASAQSKLAELQTELLNTDEKAQAGSNYPDRVSNAYNNIPTRQRLKIRLSHSFNSFLGEDNAKESEIADYRKFVQQQISGILKVYGKGIDDANAGIDHTNNSADIKAALAFQKLLKDVTTNFGKLVVTSTGKKDFEAIKKALDEALDIPKITDSTINKIKDQQRKLQPFLDKYSLKYDDKTKASGQSEFEKRTAIYNKLGELDAKRVADSKTENQKEVDAVKIKYEAILKEIEKYNREADKTNKANPKANVKKIDPNHLNIDKNGNYVDKPTPGGSTTTVADLVKKEQDDVVAKQQLVDTQNTINAQKTIYAEFEKYKTDVGVTEAKRRFTGDLKGYTDYVSYLKGLLSSIDGKNDAYSNKLRDFLAKEISKATNDQNKGNAEQLSKLLVDTQTYYDKRDSLTEKYNANVKLLLAAGLDEQAGVLTNSYHDQLTALDENNFKQLDSYKALFTDIDKVTTESARKYLNSLTDFANTSLLAGKITREAYDAIVKQILSATKTIDNRLPAGLKEVAGQFSALSGTVSQFDESLGKALGTVGSILSGAASIKENLNNIKVADTGTIAGMFSSISSSLGIVGSVIGLAGTIFSLFDTSKADAEQRKLTTELQQKATEAVNKALERQLALTKDLYGTDRITGYIKALSDLKAAQVDVQNQINGKFALTDNDPVNKIIKKINDGSANDFDKNLFKQMQDAGVIVGLAGKSLEQLQKMLDSGTLDEGTSKLVQSLVDIKKQIIDTQNALKVDLTGTEFSSLADGILQMFKEGKTASKDFADNFKTLMQTAIGQAFKTKYLETQLQTFYDSFADAFKNGAPDAATLAILQAQYEAILKDAADKFNLLQGITGVKFGGISPASGIDGAVKREITEQTGSSLEGLFRSFYDLSKKAYQLGVDSKFTLTQQLNLMTQTLSAQLEIRDNTFRTAHNTDRLFNIELATVAIAANTKTTGGTTPGYGKGIGII